jgi:2-oxoglutarate ferredoxin oxidoreductase subunit gamma
VPKGVLVINSSLVDREPTRTDIDVVLLPANELAEELGDKRMANVVLLGGLLQRLPVLTHDEIRASLQKNLPPHRRHLLEPNLKALARGAEEAAGVRA